MDRAALWVAFGVAFAACGCSSTGATGEPPPPDDPPSEAMTSGEPSSSEESTGGDPTEQPEAAECGTVGRPPLRRLTRLQYDNAIRDLLGLSGAPSEGVAADEKVGAFYSNSVAPVSDIMVEQYSEVAETLAAEAVLDLDALLPCDPEADGCADTFITEFGLRAYRRPLTERQRDLYRGLFDDGAADGGFADGIRLVVTAMLQSPYFLYQVEHSTEDTDAPVALPPHELASRLAFFLWNTIPDDALLAAADADGLRTRDAVLAEAERMLDAGKASKAISAFHRQWLDLDQLKSMEKDPTLHPEWDDAHKQSMLDETEAFADYVIREDDGRLATLLTASYSFPGGEGPVELDAAERAGILTHPSWLASHAHANQTSPVLRGVVTLTNVLCAPPPEAPNDVNNTPPDPDPDATTRERFAEHTQDPVCASCHVIIDGIGFGFEHYDEVGAFRAEENGLPVDANGQLIGTDVDGDFVGAIELAQRLGTSDQVRECTANQWFAFANRQPATASDACSMESIIESFASTDYNLRNLMVEIALSDSFRFTQGQE